MNFRKTAVAVLMAGGMLVGAAFADEYLHGEIRKITPEGIYVQNSHGVTMIPHSSSSTFTMDEGEVRVGYDRLAVGQHVRVAYGGRDKLKYIPHDWWEDHNVQDWKLQVRAYETEQMRYPEGAQRF